MLSTLSTALPPIAAHASPAPPAPQAPPTPPAAQPRGGAGADDDAAPQGFAQALDDAVTAEPRAAARERGRGAARPLAGHGAAGRADGKAASDGRPPGLGVVALPTPVDGASDATRAAPAADEAAGHRRPAAPEGVGDLLAQLRAFPPVASGAGSADAAAPGDPLDGAAAALPGRRAPVPALANAKLAALASTTGGAAGAAARAAEGGTGRSNDDHAVRLAAAPALQASAPFDAAAPATLPALPAAGVGAATDAVPAQARLPASPGSAEFGAQLAAQVTTYVRAGVQHARLQLNPAEMGPVSVHIQLDGQTALVHLSAEHAQTRQALEEAMPQLASSLREAGLTLTGGGVSEQPHQGRDAAADARAATGGTTPGRAGAALEHSESVAVPLRRRGVVDLVA